MVLDDSQVALAAPASTVEDPPADGTVRFSECNLWQAQRGFYQEEGIQAWSGKVPCHATSNPVIANAYAQLIARFLQDRARKESGPPRPAYILELGSGPGVFGFYLIRRLLEVMPPLGLGELPFVYVMSDLAEKNIAFWRDHPALRDFVTRGLLDFARYDIGAGESLHLLESDLILDSGAGGGTADAGPLIVLANYVFDTLPQDVFKVEEGRLLEGRTRGLPEGTSLPAQDNVTISLDQLGVALEFREVARPCYGVPWLDGILDRYVATAPDYSFLFPVQALRGLHHLAEIADGDLLLVATDKACGYPARLAAETQDLALHDSSFSTMVDFGALREYIDSRGGSADVRTSVQATSTAVFLLGDAFARCAETGHAVATFFHDFGPAELRALISQVQMVLPGSSPDVLVALLSLSRWDPAILNIHLDQIIEVAKAAGPELRRILAEGMRRCADHFYYLPGTESVLANVGIVFQEMQDHATALHYYRQSLDWFGTEPLEVYANTLYNVGLCRYYLGELDEALAAFREADRVAVRKDMMAKGWIHHLTTEIEAAE